MNQRSAGKYGFDGWLPLVGTPGCSVCYWQTEPRSIFGIQVLQCPECENVFYLAMCIGCQDEILVNSPSIPTTNIGVCHSCRQTMKEI